MGIILNFSEFVDKLEKGEDVVMQPKDDETNDNIPNPAPAQIPGEKDLINGDNEFHFTEELIGDAFLQWLENQSIEDIFKVVICEKDKCNITSDIANNAADLYYDNAMGNWVLENFESFFNIKDKIIDVDSLKASGIYNFDNLVFYII